MPVLPPFLKPGDTIALIATARHVSIEEMTPALNTFKDWGLKVKEGQNLYAMHHQFAGTDEQRLADLQAAFDDPEVKAVIIARGGYGTMRIIDRLDFSGITKNPKWLIGYSDVTVIHHELHKRGICSIHGTMLINFTKSAHALESLRAALMGNPVSYQLRPSEFNRHGHAQGDLVGGNLSLLYALSGSPSDINLRGKILFLEDLDEYLYHIDRMMLQLKRSGKLESLAGLVIGGMTDMRDNTIPFGFSVEQIIQDAVKPYNYPVAFNFPAGHQAENMSFYHGRKAELKVDERGSSLTYA